MITFHIPLQGASRGEFACFAVETGRVAFAGSRHGHVEPETCRLLVERLGSLGFSFITGCAGGIDACFRTALAESRYREQALVACAFRRRAESLRGLYPLYVVPDGLHPKVALAKRTLWVVSRCEWLILFPSDPIGKGSALAFRSAIMQSKPVFVAGGSTPRESDLYTVYPSSLFGIIEGWWCVPPVYTETGLCYEPQHI
jgi:hypothetical protein